MKSQEKKFRWNIPVHIISLNLFVALRGRGREPLSSLNKRPELVRPLFLSRDNKLETAGLMTGSSGDRLHCFNEPCHWASTVPASIHAARQPTAL